LTFRRPHPASINHNRQKRDIFHAVDDHLARSYSRGHARVIFVSWSAMIRSEVSGYGRRRVLPPEKLVDGILKGGIYEDAVVRSISFGGHV
jgi:hypothetical protein